MEGGNSAELVDTLSVELLSIRRETFHSFRENSGERNGSNDDGGRRRRKVRNFHANKIKDSKIK